MITHEEVKKELGDKVIFSTIPVTMNYLKQQGKKDKLLELYRKCYGKNMNDFPYETWIILENKIKELEEELK